MTIDRGESQSLLHFIERNLDLAPRNLDEGMGTAYERAVIDDYFRRLQAKYNVGTVLESPADGVTGVPGINSLEFARQGGSVWLANPSQRMLNSARSVWEWHGLIDRVRFARCHADSLPFGDGAFDLVWNYCMFERFREPGPMLAEMKRVARRYVLIMTQNAHTPGAAVHGLYHSVCGLEWDHGHREQMTFDALRTATGQQGLRILEEGTLDVPPWLDTWDMPLRVTLSQAAALIGRKWEWKLESENNSKSNSSLLSFLSGVPQVPRPPSVRAGPKMRLV